MPRSSRGSRSKRPSRRPAIKARVLTRTPRRGEKRRKEMAKRRTAPAYESGGSEEVTGAARNPADLTVEELMYQVADPARPDWMVTRFPVSAEEFEEMNEAGAKPGPGGGVA